MYGNYDSANDVSYLRLNPTRQGLRAKFNGGLRAYALLDMPYVEAGVPRHLLVTLATPLTPEEYNCHGCTFLVGAAVFSRVNGAWLLTARQLALTEAGGFAQEPLATLQPLGPDHFGFRLEELVSGGGEGTDLSIFEVSGSEIKEVFSAAKDSSFINEKCWPMPLSQAWGACVEFVGGISVMPGADPEHYDIVLSRHVTSSVTRRIPRGTYLFRYRYSAGKYVLE